MRTLNQRERILGAVSATAILLIALWQMAIAPQWTRYDRLRAEHHELAIDLTRMQANLRLKDAIEARYDALKDLIHHSGTPSQEMSRFARLLTDLYRPLRLDIKAIRPLPDKDEGFYHQFALHIEMSGPIDQVASFMAAIATSMEPVRIEKVELLCQERPDHVTASIIVTKVVTTQELSEHPGVIGVGRESLQPDA
jgi:Tfp pilus assembly protein PilO